MLFYAESYVKWCLAITILENWNLKRNVGLYFSNGGCLDSFFACLEKCDHDILIIDAIFPFCFFKAIIHKIVQNSFTARENIHA